MPVESPDLVDASEHLRNDLSCFGFDICARLSVRARLQADIEAQFRAYKQTCLTLDHVNGHKHFRLHPAVASDVIAIGGRMGCAPSAYRADRPPSWPRMD